MLDCFFFFNIAHYVNLYLDIIEEDMIDTFNSASIHKVDNRKDSLAMNISIDESNDFFLNV